MQGDGTTCIWAARPAVQRLGERGIDAGPVLARAHISSAALENVEARVPFHRVATLWDAASDAAGDPFFGLDVARTAPPGSCDVLEYLGSTSKTLGEAYERITQYTRLFYDLGNLRLLVEPEQARLAHRSRVPAMQFHEFLFGYLVVRGRQWTATDWRPQRVTFQHARSGGLPVFDCPVEFGAAGNELQLRKELLALPHVHADSRLLDILLRHADSQLAAMPERGDFIGRVAASLTRQLASHLPTLSSTAAALHMSERTLQRRLGEHGVTFRLLLDEVRRGLALKYVVHAGVSMSEIAYLLHFSDGTAFQRAFKRWTGASPAAYRERALVG